MESEVTRLAEAAVAVLADAAATDQWSSVRAEFLGSLGRPGEAMAGMLDQLAIPSADAGPRSAERREQIRTVHVQEWAPRLSVLLQDDPEAAARLREFLDRFMRRMGPGPGSGSAYGVVQQSVAGYTVLGGSINVYAAGRDVHLNE